MKLFKNILLVSGLSLAGVAVADCGSCCVSPCAPKPTCSPCANPCDKNPCCHDAILGIGGTYTTSGDLHGWGGFINIDCNLTGNHFLGLQFTALEERGYRSGSQVVNVPANNGFPASTTDVTQHRKAQIDQYLLMLNYTYRGCFEGCGCCGSDFFRSFTYYLGAGIGLDFIQKKDRVSNYEVSSIPAIDIYDRTQSFRHHHIAIAGQLFAGLGYNITDSIEIFTGVRALFAGKSKFNAKPGGSATTISDSGVTTMHTDATQLLVDMGINYHF